MSGKPVVLRLLARQDVEAIIDHYMAKAGESVALGFIDALERTLGRVARHPASGSPRFAHELDLPGLRFHLLRRYPYLVFYMERPEHVDVWRVLHSERDLPAWLRENEAERS